MDKMGKMKPGINFHIRNEFDIKYVESTVKEYFKNTYLPSTINEVIIILSELGYNLLRNGNGGIIKINYEKDKIGITAINNNGKNFPKFAMDNGFSTRNSLGIGLGAINRLADSVFISYENRLKTNVIKFANPKEIKFKSNIAVISYPKNGNIEENGDGYTIIYNHNSITFVVVDVLGHGPKAYKIKKYIIDLIEKNAKKYEDLFELFSYLHNAMRGSLGAAIGIAKLFMNNTANLEYIGLGNIELRIYTDSGMDYLRSKDGVLGEGNPKIFIERRKLSKCVLCMWSDGISNRLKVNNTNLSTIEIAQHLMDTYRKGTDDTTVLVAKIGRIL